MKQTTLTESTFAKYKKPTKKEKFLAQIYKIIPWKELSEVIEPHYPMPKGSGRRPIGIERMPKEYQSRFANISNKSEVH